MYDGAEFGATNYVLKLPVYIAVNGLDFLSPHAKLLILALVFNLLTFIGIMLVTRQLLRLYGISLNAWYVIGALWLAAISERVFWLDYANSRNLETVGGLFVLYLGLRLYKRPSSKGVVLLMGIGGLAFFADQLQLYVIGGGLLIGALLLAAMRRSKAQLLQSTYVVLGVAGAVVISKLLLIGVTKLLPISFLIPPTGSSFNLSTILASIKGTASSTLFIFDVDFYAAGSVANTLRQSLNAILLGLFITLIVYAWRKASVARRELTVMILCCMLAAYGAYLASGQAPFLQTQRYLIMVPILFFIVIATLADKLIINRRILQATSLLIIIMGFVLVTGALVANWPNRYSKDVHITQTLEYLKEHEYSFAMGSRDGIPMTYFSSNAIVVAPLICQPEKRLVASNLFFDKAGFDKARNMQNIPLIMPPGGIISSGSICDETDVISQFGTPVRIEQLNTGARAYIYDSLNL